MSKWVPPFDKQDHEHEQSVQEFLDQCIRDGRTTREELFGVREAPHRRYQHKHHKYNKGDSVGE